MSAKRPGFLSRLYRGETNIEFIGHRKRWYLASALLLAICVASIALRWFHFGVEFVGGSQFVVPVKPGTTLAQVENAVGIVQVEVSSTQEAGQGANRKYVIKTPPLTDEQRQKMTDALAVGAKVNADEVDFTEVSSSWGKSVTQQALIGLVVFLVLVGGYLWIRFERKMAYAALAALLHDIALTAGVYSLVGFEVTPATIIGFLTILGFSLYDSVVVFDKVDENTRGLLGSTRFTYPEAANLALNQTLMRSINTTLIALLPVAGLLFIGAGVLGVGTLKDLALVLFVGMLTGAYSSLFLATPWLVDFKLLEPKYKLHMQRILAKRTALVGERVEKAEKGGTAKKAGARAAAADEPDEELASSAPAPGARPAAGPRKRQGGGKGRPTGAKRRR